MNSKLLQLQSTIIPALSLENADSRWKNTFQASIAGRAWNGVKQALAALGHPAVPKFGSTLQQISFLLVLALMVALGLPQFAGDKEGLALFIVAAAGLRLLGTAAGGKESYRASAIDALVLAFLGINVVATFASHYLAASLFGLAKVAIYIAGYFVFTASLGSSRKRIIWTIVSLLSMGFLVSLYGLYQYKTGVAPLATWEDPTVEIKATRIFSTLGNPNLLAAYLIPMIPLAAAMGIVATAHKKWLLSIIPFGAAVVFAVACLLTGSRGAYGGIAAALFSFLLVAAGFLWKSKPKARPAIVVLLVAFPLLAWLGLHRVPSFEQRFESIFAGSEHSSNAFRMMVWRASWRMFLDNWWFGIGPGNKTFVLAYGLYMTSGFDALGTYCVPLEVAVETGIFGLGIFAALLTATLAKSHLGFWQAADNTQRWLSLGCASALLGMMAHGAVDTVFYRPQVQFIFWLLIALVVALRCPHSPVSPQFTPKASSSGP